MKYSKDYYRNVLRVLLEGPRRRFPDKLLDRVLAETDGTAEIDDFRERFSKAMAAPFNQPKKKAKKENEDEFTPTPNMVNGGGEERATPDNNNVDANDVDSNAPDASDAAPLQPGEVPKSSPTVASHPKISYRTENLPNTRSGQSYDISLDELLGGLPAHLQLENDGGSGLSLSSDRRLQGIPPTSGSFQLDMVGLDDKSEPILHLQLKLALIPNSRDLWKNLSSDPEAPYAKADEDVDRQFIDEGWCMAMGSLRGRSHAHRAGQRDDHGVIARAESGWNILIVGDGAGSCEFSRQGSFLATTSARDTLLDSLEGDEGALLEAAVLAWWKEGNYSRMPQEILVPLQSTVITAVHAGYRAISDEAKTSGYPIKAFSTTLLLALHKETSEGHVVVTFGIGDGAIGALTEGRQAQMLNTADSGEHAGQTRFLDAPLFHDAQKLYQRITVKVFDSLSALVVATDGVTDPKFSSDNDMHDAESWWAFYDDLAPALPATVEKGNRDPLLDYLSFFVERHHDDRTLAVLYRDAGASLQFDSELSS